MKRILISAAMLLLAGCASAPKTDPAADKEAIGKLRDAFNAAFNENDAAKIGDLYTENAVVMNANQPTLNGRAAVIAGEKMLFDLYKAKITLKPNNTSASGDLGYDEGTYRMEMTPKAAGEKPVIDEGRYLVILTREKDGWRVIEDIGNSSAPLAAPAPVAKPKAAAKPKATTKAKAK